MAAETARRAMAEQNLTASEVAELNLVEYAALLDPRALQHAGLLLLAWGVVLPLSTLIPLLCRGRADRRWVWAYLPLVLASLGATAYGIVLSWDFNAERSAAHLASAHSMVSFATVGLALVVSVTGFFPKSSSDFRVWSLMMLWIGRACLCVGVAALLTGVNATFAVYGRNDALLLVQAGLGAVFGIVVLGIATCSFRRGPSRWQGGERTRKEEFRNTLKFSRRTGTGTAPASEQPDWAPRRKAPAAAAAAAAALAQSAQSSAPDEPLYGAAAVGRTSDPEDPPPLPTPPQPQPSPPQPSSRNQGEQPQPEQQRPFKPPAPPREPSKISLEGDRKPELPTRRGSKITLDVGVPSGELTAPAPAPAPAGGQSQNPQPQSFASLASSVAARAAQRRPSHLTPDSTMPGGGAVSLDAAVAPADA